MDFQPPQSHMALQDVKPTTAGGRAPGLAHSIPLVPLLRDPLGKSPIHELLL